MHHEVLFKLDRPAKVRRRDDPLRVRSLPTFGKVIRRYRELHVDYGHLGTPPRVKLIVDANDAYEEVIEMHRPTDRFTTYEVSDAPWIEYFGLGKLVRRPLTIGRLLNVDITKGVVKLQGQGLVTQARVVPPTDSRTLAIVELYMVDC